LAGLTLCGLLLRLYRADSGLWIDEVTSVLDSFRLPLGELISTYSGDNRHPLYSVLAHMAMAVFGESAWTARLPSILFGTASIPALYLLGREMGGSRMGLLAAALLTVSYHHVWFSQNARGYAMLAFFSILATYLLLRGLATRKAGFFVGYALAAGLGSYTHLTMVFLALGQAAVMLWLKLRRGAEDAPRWTDLATAFVGGAALTLLLYAPMLRAILRYFGEPTDMLDVSTPSWAALEILRQMRVGFGTAFAGAAAGLFLAGGAWSLFRRAPVALSLFVAPLAVTLLGAAAARGTMYPRFFFFASGFAVLFVVHGIEWIGGLVSAEPKRRARATAVLFAAIAAASVVSLRWNYRYPKQDFGGAQAFVEEHIRDGETAMVVGVTVRPLQEYLGQPWPDVRSVEDLLSARRQGAVWLVYSFPRYVASSYPGVWSLIESDSTLEARLPGTVGGGDVLVCRFSGLRSEEEPGVSGDGEAAGTGPASDRR